MKSVLRFFAQRHTLATLLIIMTILLGLGTLTRIKRDILPAVDFGEMIITTRYPGASPEDVELNLTNKIEDELKGLTGIERITSVSMEDMSLVDVKIDPDEKNQNEIKRKIREAVDRVTDFPPEVTQAPLVDDISTANFPVIEIGLSGDIPYRELREYARQFEKKLREVSGVARLERFGYLFREIKVEVSPEAVTQYQIPLPEIIAAIRARNIRATAGNFESYTSDKNLVTLAQFRNPLEVGDVIVRSSFEGPIIQLKDLAVVRDDFEDQTIISRINGSQAISFVVYKTESADIIRTVDAVKELASQERGGKPEGVEILYSDDASAYVRNRFQVVQTNGLIGLAFVLVILSLCLNIRTAFWVALGIPVALMGTIFLMPIFGVYLDTISLAAMIIVIGIIVDDAIIISENIYRRSEKGDPPLEAAVEGAYGVFWPVLTTILTTFLAFASMFFITGIFGKFVFVIPLVISLALFLSLFEVMIALPAHLLPGLCKTPGSCRVRSWCSFLRSRYSLVVFHILRFRYLMLVLAVLLLAGSVWYGVNYMKFVLFPADASDQFFILTELPVGTPLESTSEKLKEIENLAAGLPEEEVASLVTRAGANPVINAESESYGYISVNLTPYASRDRTAGQIVEELRQKTNNLPGYKKITYSVQAAGPPVGKPIAIRVVGSVDRLRTKLADSLETYLSAIQGIKDIERDDKAGKDQVELKIDYRRLSRLGLTVADVAQNVRIAYDGEVVTSVRYGDEDVDFRVLLEEKARRKPDYVRELPIPNRQGRLIPLREVATLKMGPGPADYRHYNGERAIMVQADVNKEIITPLEVTRSVFSHFNLERNWKDSRLVLEGEVEETRKSLISLTVTLALAGLGVYCLLILLFNSWTQPLLVMLAIPFGITGIIIAFTLHGEPLSFMAVLGLIGLAGVVVNDSLVLVNHINELRRRNPDRNALEVVAEATSNRVRAIVMTTVSTVAGLVPLAYGLGGTDVFIAPMALALGYGLLFATPLTLVLVPCLYAVRLDAGRVLSRIGRIFRKSERA
ncbi:MAG: efflux RND transporter permease subunit [Candidatus Zixiibacteriota bacterium]